MRCKLFECHPLSSALILASDASRGRRLETIIIDGLTVLRALPAGAARRSALFVHGFFADASIWSAWLERFAGQGVAAYAVDLRGRGGSRPGTALGRASVEDFADDARIVAR